MVFQTVFQTTSSASTTFTIFYGTCKTEHIWALTPPHTLEMRARSREYKALRRHAQLIPKLKRVDFEVPTARVVQKRKQVVRIGMQFEIEPERKREVRVRCKGNNGLPPLPAGQ